MSVLARQRCFHHPGREAVARCLNCRDFFCRECITEHEGRVLCASCLVSLTTPAAKPTRSGISGRVWMAGGAVGGLLVAWMTFYFLGRMLLSMPSEFHASSLWKSSWLENSESDPP